ncbi:MAG TPA: NmrA-like protein [Rhizorhapis sp.]|nr:NmrA-like protein [Rhizorhapis sp.]
MSQAKKILVLGATGNTGGALVQLLKASGTPLRTAARGELAGSPDHVRFVWDDRRTHGPAVAGVERLYLVAPVGAADPPPLVKPFLAEALAGGLQRVVLLSSSAVKPGDPGLGQIDALVRATVPEWAILRPSWFMQNFVGDHPLADGIRSRGEIVTATGDGRLPFVDARDIAATAAALLRADSIVCSEHLVTGPQALSYADAAALVSEMMGRPVRHVAITEEALTQRLITAGYEAAFASALAGLDADIRAGRQAQITDTVQRLTGQPPRSLRDFIAEHRELLDGA